MKDRIMYWPSISFIFDYLKNIIEINIYIDLARHNKGVAAVKA